MAQYFLSAEDFNLGDSFAETPWNGTTGRFNVEVVSDNGRKAFKFTKIASGWGTVDLVHGLDLAGVCEVHASLRGQTTANEPDFHILLWSSGSSTGVEGIGANNYRGYRITKIPYSALGSATYANNEVPHNVVFRSNGIDDHKLYAYDDGAVKPATPLIQTTTAVAYTGNDGLTFLCAVDNQEFYLYTIAIGTNGDPAPTGPVAPGGTETNLTLAPIHQHTQAEAVSATQVSAVDAVILSQSANSEIASVSQIATASGVESQQISQVQQAGLALSAFLGSVDAQQLTSAEALDVSIVQPDSLAVAVVEQLLQAEPVSASQSALLDAVIGQSRTQALAVQVAADYTLMAVTAEQLAQVAAVEILDGTGLQVVTVEQSTISDTASVTLLTLVDGTAVEQGTNANLVVTAATLVITASQSEQLTEAEIADIVGSAMFLDPRELTVSRTTKGFTVRRTTPTYTMQLKHSVH